jgi:hypothetical protein
LEQWEDAGKTLGNPEVPMGYPSAVAMLDGGMTITFLGKSPLFEDKSTLTM